MPERRQEIEKRLSAEREIPASSQRVEIVQEITEIKRHSVVEDKIAEVEVKSTQPEARPGARHEQKVATARTSRPTADVKTAVRVTAEDLTAKPEVETREKQPRRGSSQERMELLEGVADRLENKTVSRVKEYDGECP